MAKPVLLTGDDDLGLDTVARVVRKHRGNVRFESKLGETCFQVRLPIEVAADERG